MVGASLEAFRQVWSGESLHAANVTGGLHHAMRDRASGFCVYNDVAVGIQCAARPGRRAGGVRRRGRAPRRRRGADLLGRPAGPHDLPARDRADAVPRDRLPRGPRRRGRGGHGRQRRPAAGHRGRRVAARLPRRGPGPGARVRARRAGHPARLRLARRRPPRAPDAQRRRPARGVPRPPRPGPRDRRRALGRHRRRRLRAGRGGAARLDAPAGHRRRVTAGPGDRVRRSPGAPTSGSGPGPTAPTALTDGRSPGYRDWSDGFDPDTWLDREIAATRRAVFPLHGLDPGY